MALKMLRRIQMGPEATAGTAVAATGHWRGPGTIQDNLEIVFVEEDIGVISGSDRSYIPKLGAEIDFEEVEATFEQLPYLLEAGIKAIQTGVADGTGTGKIYDYAFPTTAQATIKTYTIEGGDDAGAERMEYSFVEEFTLSGKQGEAWKMGGKWRGRQVAVNAFTSSPAYITVEEILFGKTKLYIDPIATAFGTSQKSNTLMEASLNFRTGWQPTMDTGDGQLYFPGIKCANLDITLNITFEHDATSVAEKVNWRAQTARSLQLKAEGSAVTKGSGVYEYKSLIINLAGKWEKFEKIGENNGNDIVQATFRSRYNTANTKFGNIIVVNTLATIV